MGAETLKPAIVNRSFCRKHLFPSQVKFKVIPSKMNILSILKNPPYRKTEESLDKKKEQFVFMQYVKNEETGNRVL